MARAGGDCGITAHNLPLADERADGAVACCVSDAVARIAPVTFRPHEVVHPFALQHEGAFHIVLRGNFPVHRLARRGNHMRQVGRETNHVAVALAAVIQVDGAVVVAEHHGVDGLRTVLKGTDEWLAEQVFKRTIRLVAYSNTDATGKGTGLLDVVRREKEIVLPVQGNSAGSPDGIRRPSDVSNAQHLWVPRPVQQVWRREGIQTRLKQVIVHDQRAISQMLLGRGKSPREIPGLRISLRQGGRGVNPVLAGKHMGFGICVPALR